MSHLLISAAHKSSGKTTIAMGLCAALEGRGVNVQPFKKGPDYIDALWLGRAAGRECYNLDFHTMPADEIRSCFADYTARADLSLIEGNKGLHDGVNVDGSNSNAALAKLLRTPVVLVIDTRGTTRGVAPLLLGYQNFDREVHIAGVILNQVGGPRHESKLRAAIERFTDLPVLGAVGRDATLSIVERHLGLVPANERLDAQGTIARIRATVENDVDIDSIVALTRDSGLPKLPSVRRKRPAHPDSVRLGIARDAAFGFYYPDDLQALEAAGAELVTINTLRDAALPAIDGLFIGGGFPETHMHALESNRSLRRSIADAIGAGLPVYAECGGLMYLAKRLIWGDARCDMVGAFNADVRLHDRPQGRGYVRLRETGHHPWRTEGADAPRAVRPAHEFHHSQLVNPGADFDFAYEVLRGHGIDGEHDGIVFRNVLASYAHLRHGPANPWAQRFVGFIRACRAQHRQLKTG